jgi:predicted polyphosphate/ATP-dependent NAD kinase
MGADALRAAGFGTIDVVHEPAAATAAGDTVAAAEVFRERGIDVVLFCGGDGTARDICGVVGDGVPILGIPSGVKMYSGVFGTNPRRTAEILFAFLRGQIATAPADVLDLDEERYRKGEWAVRLYHAALTPFEPTFTQAAKALIDEASDEEVKREIAGYLEELIADSPETLFLLGPGSTVRSIGAQLGIAKTLLGIDAVAGGGTVGTDLDERGILALLDRYPECRLVLSPIGAQGFVLGRGNLQLSPAAIRRIGTGHIIVVATPAKLARTPVLRFDTGDAGLDAALAESGYVPVVTGYRLRRLAKVEI